ncbi:MAG: hypothetical protein L0322_22075 [Chloroflexi bacterium]|nr:hypothetical protein [Chloroflexota bacterium]MCI0577387.1 hypothetical protein [Chloroflexota bacterium]MCI0647074.1 hypothetical protein [Chloroflexota bacterium]
MSDEAIPATRAAELIISGRAPAGLRVRGHLDLSGRESLATLPAGLAASSLDLSGCTALRALPAGLRVRRLALNGCTTLPGLPAGFTCYELEMRETAVRSLPADLRVEYRLDLSGSRRLQALPAGLKVGSLILRDCTALAVLPEGLDVYFLDISGCTSLADWPETGSLKIGRLSARGCTRLRTLPAWLGTLSQLDVRHCINLRELPEGLRVTSWLDLANTQLQSLPASMQGVQLLWQGVPINERIAFQPEAITAQEVLQEDNLELRRVLLARMGYESFVQQAGVQILDRDYDAGGERRLLRAPLPNEEDLVCVAVLCPSTGRQYIIRVPPTTKSCHQAAAWIAGFDNPNNYRPILET